MGAFQATCFGRDIGRAKPSDVLIVGVAGLVAGAMSMAAGEYVSGSSQSDTQQGSKRPNLLFVLGRRSGNAKLLPDGGNSRSPAVLVIPFIKPHAVHDNREFCARQLCTPSSCRRVQLSRLGEFGPDKS